MHDHEITLENQHRIQQLLDSIRAEITDEHPHQVAERIRLGIKSLGIPPQPAKWVGDTAEMLRLGPVYLNGREASAHVEEGTSYAARSVTRS